MESLLYATLASLITWSATAGGAALVFVTPRLPRSAMAVLFGFAAALMAWAAFTGLLWPALATVSERSGTLIAVTTVLASAFVGGLVIRIIRHRLSVTVDHGPTLGRQLFLAMTLHHVPEGMAVGLSVAAAVAGDATAAAGSAALVLAMALHNAAEGALVSLPLRHEGATRWHAWSRGQLSGVAEIVGAVLGATAVVFATSILPWALAAAGGAMLAVVVGDLVPELRSQLFAQRPASAERVR